MKTDIILCGVGGQGILSIATIIGEAAMKENLYIKQAEVHGMSQRGGDVQSNLRISSNPIASDLIALGGADVIISMEPMEALRYLPFLAKDGWIITSSAPFVNIPNYPDIETIKSDLSKIKNVILLDIEQARIMEYHVVPTLFSWVQPKRHLVSNTINLRMLSVVCLVVRVRLLSRQISRLLPLDAKPRNK